MNYKIYQIENRDCPYMFLNYDYARAHGLRLSDYKCVYAGEVDQDISSDSSLMNYLEYLFEKFNLFHPEDFMGHSLSVSDIVYIDEVGYFYTDMCGFKKIE